MGHRSRPFHGPAVPGGDQRFSGGGGKGGAAGWRKRPCSRSAPPTWPWGETGAALQALDELLAVTADDEMRDRVWLRVGWIYLDQGEFAAARQAFARVRPESREKLGIGELEEGLERAGDLPRKSPAGRRCLFAGARRGLPSTPV